MGTLAAVFDVVVVAVVVSGFVLLGVSAARHLRWREAFVGQLRAQRLWPDGAEVAVAWGVTGAEAVVGAGGVLGLSFGSSAATLAPLLVAMALLGVAFVALQVFLLVRLPDVPCGCNPGHDGRAGVGTLLKAAWPVVAGVVGLVGLPAEALDELSLAAACLAVFAGLGLAWLLDTVPVLFDRA